MPAPERYTEFAALLERHTGRLLTYINALLLNWDDAEDVFQECCLVLWSRFDEFQPGTNFLAWALRVAQHKAMDFKKARSRRQAFFNQQLQDLLIAEVTDARYQVDDEGLAALIDCIEKLGESDRRLLQLCYGEGVRVREVAAQLGRSPQSVHNSLRRIRLVLLGCIKRALNQAERQ